MGFFVTIQALFSKLAASSAHAVRYKPAYDIAEIMAASDIRLAEDFRQAEVASREFEQQYGEFRGFLCRPEFDLFLRKEVLLFWEPTLENKSFLDTNHWHEKHLFNFPGPFYVGESDTCGTGIVYAPSNVVNDSNGCEYIFRQPTSYYELLCILNAAAIEVFDSYSSNGNDYWTYNSCKQWWQSRGGLLQYLTRKEVVDANEGQAQLYLDYLNGEAEMDLRRYCYFLEQGHYPPDDQTALPEL